MKPFTLISALIFLAVAAIHAWRAYSGIPVSFDGTAIPVMWSWIITGVAAVLGIGLLLESRR